MPIRPENRNRYPKNWKSEIVPRIRARSKNRCECTGQCGFDHTIEAGDMSFPRCNRENGDIVMNFAGDKLSTVVLTVAHLDHTPENCVDDNLMHMCQRCHNRYDAPMRRRGISERARAQRASGDLFKCEEVT